MKKVEDLFKNRQDDKIGLIKESIEEIQSMIKNREGLHKEMLGNLDKISLFIDNSMPKPTNITQDNMAAHHELIKELLKKKIEVEELRIEEKLNVWRDCALLKKELREHMKEFRDIESKTNMLDNLINM